MMSLKPPWKQKNPAMEKACPVYYKNTAPAFVVKFVEDLKLVDYHSGKELEPEYVGNFTWESNNGSVLIWWLKTSQGEDAYAWSKIFRHCCPPGKTILEVLANRANIFYKGKEVKHGLNRGFFRKKFPKIE